MQTIYSASPPLITPQEQPFILRKHPHMLNRQNSESLLREGEETRVSPRAIFLVLSQGSESLHVPQHGGLDRAGGTTKLLTSSPLSFALSSQTISSAAFLFSICFGYDGHLSRCPLRRRDRTDNLHM